MRSRDRGRLENGVDLLVVEVNDLVAKIVLTLSYLCFSNHICIHLVAYFIFLAPRIFKFPIFIHASYIDLLVLDRLVLDGQKGPRAARNISLDIYDTSRRLPDVPFIAPDELILFPIASSIIFTHFVGGAVVLGSVILETFICEANHMRRFLLALLQEIEIEGEDFVETQDDANDVTLIPWVDRLSMIE